MKKRGAKVLPFKPKAEAPTVIEVEGAAVAHLAGTTITVDAHAYTLMEALAGAIEQMHGPVEGPKRAQQYREGVIASWAKDAAQKGGAR